VKRSKYFAIALLIGLLTSAGTMSFASEITQQQQRLDFGAVLYEVYQDHYFTAAVQLLAKQSLSARRDAALFLGGMYLSYGMHDEAEQVFNSFTDEQLPAQTKDQAWFYMAKLRYQRGLIDQAWQSLKKVGESLPDDLREQYVTLKTLLQFAQGHYQQAIDDLHEKASKQDPFILYNLAYGYQQLGDEQTALKYFNQVMALTPKDAFEQDLQDKVLVILARQYITQQQPELARKLLNNLSMESPYTPQALIMLAWVELSDGNYARALAPLRLIGQRYQTGQVMQESWLLHGYVLEQAEAYRDALAVYREALVRYQEEERYLTDTLASIEQGRFVQELIPQLQGKAQGWSWEGELTPDADLIVHLGEMIASHPFYESLKSLRDVIYLDQQLKQWKRDLPIYQHMLALRKQRYHDHLPVLERAKTNQQSQQLIAQKQQLENQLREIVNRHDIQAFTTEREQKMFEHLQKVETLLASIPEGKERQAYQQRYQRLKGLLQWDLEMNFKLRVWEQQKSLNDIAKVLQSTEQQQQKLQQSTLITPELFEQYNYLLQQIDQQIDLLSQRNQLINQKQQQQLTEQAREIINQRLTELNSYRDQVYFRLARLNDMAIANQESEE